MIAVRAACAALGVAVGRPRRVHHRGQSWIEWPGAHHVLTANTSRARPARLLVVFVSHTGDRLKVNDPPKGRHR